MNKRLIGIELGENTLRLAILRREKSQISVSSLLERDFQDQEELGPLLRELLAGEFGIGDQVVACLPARSVYLRSMDFPFQDEKKIAAAIPFELSTQLPVAVESCATAIQQVQKTDQGAKVVAAAVPIATLQPLLDLFDEANVPLHIVDLAPFCYVAGLGEQIGSAVLVCATDQETTVSLVTNGRLGEYRSFSSSTKPNSPAFVPQLLREVRALTHANGAEALPLILMGSGVSPELIDTLQEAVPRVEMLSAELGDQTIPGEFLPAVALALRADMVRNDSSFNLRTGPYVLKGEWANLKRKLVVLAALLGAVVLIIAGSMTLRYMQKASLVEQQKSEMTAIYRTLFPDATTIVDVPLQLESAIRELQQKGNLVSGDQASPLTVLKEVSRLPDVVAVEILEFTFDQDELKLAGRSASFDAVNQMAKVMEESPVFTGAQVTDAKMSLDGSRVDFRLTLLLAKEGREQ